MEFLGFCRKAASFNKQISPNLKTVAVLCPFRYAAFLHKTAPFFKSGYHGR